MKSYNEIKELLLRDYPKYFDILDLDMQIRGLFGVDEKDYKEQLDRNLDNYMDCSKIVANNEGLRDHNWLKQEYERLLNIYNDIKNTYKEADNNMNLYKGIKSKLNEAYDVSRTMNGNIDEVANWTVTDFIADGRYSYDDKIKYIAVQLEESGNVDSYPDSSWNDYLLKVANILYRAANEISRLKGNLNESEEVKCKVTFECSECEYEFSKKFDFDSEEEAEEVFNSDADIDCPKCGGHAYPKDMEYIGGE